jgi:hypothetical protein
MVEILRSPLGEALYPRLTEPDDKFDPDGLYSVRLRLPEDAESTQKLVAFLEDKAQEGYELAKDKVTEGLKKKTPKAVENAISKIKMADLPFKPEEDDEGNETGFILFNFKMKASGVSKKTGKSWTRRPALFDSQGSPIDPDSVDIWSGTKLYVAFTAQPFYFAAVGAGVSTKLEAAQIIDLVNGGSRSAEAYGFEAQEGGFEANTGDRSEKGVASEDDTTSSYEADF